MSRKRQRPSDESASGAPDAFSELLQTRRGYLLLSDLHFNVKNLAVCRRILEFAHHAALERNLAIGFLGDMFDTIFRIPSLPMSILNTLLEIFSSWRVPTIMIFGNHDVVAGSDHSLHLFHAVNPKYIKVIDIPTMIDLGVALGGKQMWFPWTKDNDRVCGEITEQAPDVVFGHFEVGAPGIHHGLLHNSTKIYSGHYHQYHTRGAITYIGSPYQTNFGEAGNDNIMLILLFTSGFLETETLSTRGLAPLHYIFRTEEEIIPLLQSGQIHKGDKVRLDAAVSERILGQLHAQGATVGYPPQRIGAADVAVHVPVCNSFRNMWEEYGQVNRFDMKTVEWKMVYDQLGEELGMDTLVCIQFTELKLKGFGPYVREVCLKLDVDGPVVLTSGDHSSSNGKGKSMLTSGALLWVLSGDIDERASISFHQPDTPVRCGSKRLINTNVNKAEVWLEGKTGNSRFLIHRSVSLFTAETLTIRIDGIEKRGNKRDSEAIIATEILGIRYYKSPAQTRTWLLQNLIWMQNSQTTWLSAINADEYQRFMSSLINLHKIEDMHLELKQNSMDLKTKWRCLITQQETENKLLERADAELQHQRREKQRWISETTLQMQDLPTDIDFAKEEAAMIAASTDVRNYEVEILIYQTKYPLAALPPLHETTCDDLKLTMANCDAVFQHNLQEEVLAEFELRNIENNPEIYDLKQSITSVQQKINALHSKGIIPATPIEAAEYHAAVLVEEKLCPTCNRPFDCDDTERRNIEARCSRTEYREYLNSEQILSDKLFKHTAERRRQAIHFKEYVLQKKNSINAFIRTLIEHTKTLLSYAKSRYTYAKSRVESYRLTQILQTYPMEAVLTHASSVRREIQESCASLHAKTEDTKALAAPYENMLTHQPWFSKRPNGFLTFVTNYITQQVVQKASRWLQVLFPDEIQPTITIHPSKDSDRKLSFDIHLQNHTGIPSGGQMRLLELAAFMGMKEIFPQKTSLLIFDEATAPMDDDNRQHFINLVNIWCTENRRDFHIPSSCILISHEPQSQGSNSNSMISLRDISDPTKPRSGPRYQT